MSLIPPAEIVINGNDRGLLAVIAEAKAALADLAKTTTNVNIGGELAPLVDAISKATGLTTAFGNTEANAKLGADDAALITKLAQARTALLSLTKSVASVDPKLDMSEVIGQIAELKSLLGEENLDVNLDIKPALLQMTELKGELALLKLDEVLVKLSTGPALAEATALQETIDRLTANITVGADINNAELAAKLASVDATIALAKADLAVTPTAAGGGGGLSAILTALGWGGGKGIAGMGAGMASFGSALGLAGFGAESAVGTSIGVLGSLGGAALGGGLLGAGALGTMGVGMGTDLAGIGQAAGDIKNVYSAQSQLNTAMAQYNFDLKTLGAGSPTTVAALQNVQQAQASLNSTLGSFSPVARSAVLAAANTAQAFHQMFNAVTGQAEKTGAQIIQQAMKVGMAFLPTIGKYAAQNMDIIKKDIQPFFTWLTSMGSTKIKLPGLPGSTSVGTGGLSIFQNLEQLFQKQLPTAIAAGTQAFEFFAKTIDVAAQYTGGFLKAVDKLFTHMNSAKSFGSWAQEVGNLIGLFHSWLDLFGSALRVVAEVFKPAVGLGKDLADLFRGLLTQLGNFLALGSTQSALKGLFSAHNNELIAGLGGILKALMPALEGAVLAFVKLGTVMKMLAGGVLVGIAKALNAIANNPIGRWLATIGASGFLAVKVFGGLASAAKLAYSAITLLPTRLGVLALNLQKGATAALSMGKSILTTAGQWASSIGSIIASGAKWVAQAIAKVAVVVATNIAAAASVAAAWLVANAAMIGIWGAIIAAVVIAIVEIKDHWRGIVTFFTGLWGDIEKAAIAVWDYVKKHWEGIVIGLAAVVTGPIGALVVWLAEHWNTVKSDAVTAWNAVIAFLKRVGSDIVGAFKGAGTWLLQVGKDIINGLISGISSMFGAVESKVKGLGKDVVGWAKDAWHVFSPSTDFIEIGQYLVQGLSQGIGDSGEASTVQSALQSLATKMLEVFKGQVPLWHSAGVSMMEGLTAGISATAASVAAEASKAATGALSAAKSATRTSSPSADYAELGANWILGAIQGVHSQAGALKSSVSSTVTGALPSAGLGVGGRGSGLTGGLTVTYGPITIISPTGTTPDLSAALQKALQQNNEQLLTSIRAGAGMTNG